MREETVHEKHFRDTLPPDIGETAQVTFGYQDYLKLLQENLQSLYGEHANWSDCIEQYFSSDEYQQNCHIVKHCEDIPILTKAQIERMLNEDTEYHCLTKEFLQLSAIIKGESHSPRPNSLLRAAEILGILPGQKAEGLFRWIISRKGLDNTKKQKLEENIRKNYTSLYLAEEIFLTLFTPGLQLSFPCVGTAMTQQKGKYYYRGENAYYGSSKPGFFRQRKNNTLMLADYLILNEACFFLDQFDAVKFWGPSAPNYLALAQHYGIKTPMIDLTTDFKTALFFACCKYQDEKWHPLTKKDFEKKGARPDVPVSGDSRYGIIYRSPTEITDMKWALSNDDIAFDIITPVGYQPFMRCSHQHGYMLLVKNPQYDLLRDPLFDKFRIELDEELCQWIFEEMDQGNKVYPNDDIPVMEKYMKKIRSSHVISQRTFNHVLNNRSKQQAEVFKKSLQRAGYSIASGQIEHITNNKLRKVNRQYSIDVALSKLDTEAKSRPIMRLPSETIVTLP